MIDAGFLVTRDGERVAAFTNESDARNFAIVVVENNPDSRIEVRELRESTIEIWEGPDKER